MAKDNDKSIIVFIKFMVETHNMGIIYLKKMSTIFLVNRVMNMVLEMNLNFDKSFKLTLTQP